MLWGTFRLCGDYTQMRTIFSVTLPHCHNSIREMPQESRRTPGVNFRLGGGGLWKSQMGSLGTCKVCRVEE